MCICYHSLDYLINTRSNMVSLCVCLNLCLSLEAGFHGSAVCNPDVNWNFLFSWVLGETWTNSQFLILWVSQAFSTISKFPMDLTYFFPSWVLQLIGSPFCSTATRHETRALFWLTYTTHPLHKLFTSQKVCMEEPERKKWRKSLQLWWCQP